MPQVVLCIRIPLLRCLFVQLRGLRGQEVNVKGPVSPPTPVCGLVQARPRQSADFVFPNHFKLMPRSMSAEDRARTRETMLAVTKVYSISCSSSGALQAIWDLGNCLRGASAQLWRRDPHTNLPQGGDAAMCNASASHPGKYTCESRLDSWNAKNIMLEPVTPSMASRLVVFLPGTGTLPSNYTYLLRAAQRANHYVIGLAYLSQPIAVSAFNAWCAANLEPRSVQQCNERAHKTMIIGLSDAAARRETGGLWDVDVTSSVEYLLLAALRSVRWGKKFSNGSKLSWEHIIVSGHSQGAGHAAYWASQRSVLGAILFSGPQDSLAAAAPWLVRHPAAGQIRRIFMSAHEECGPNPIDPASYCSANTIARNAALMKISFLYNWTGIGGGSFDLDGTGIVISFVEPDPGCKLKRRYHCSTAIDGCAPLDTSDISLLWVSMFSNLSAPSTTHHNQL